MKAQSIPKAQDDTTHTITVLGHDVQILFLNKRSQVLENVLVVELSEDFRLPQCGSRFPGRHFL
jgi:hypothetical protein